MARMKRTERNSTRRPATATLQSQVDAAKQPRKRKSDHGGKQPKYGLGQGKPPMASLSTGAIPETSRKAPRKERRGPPIHRSPSTSPDSEAHKGVGKHFSTSEDEPETENVETVEIAESDENVETVENVENVETIESVEIAPSAEETPSSAKKSKKSKKSKKKAKQGRLHFKLTKY